MTPSITSGNNLLERLKWILTRNKDMDPGMLAAEIVREIETTHRIVAPDEITEDMLNACFAALPKHYDPPDPTRRAWHTYKARHRFSAMVRAVRRMV